MRLADRSEKLFSYTFAECAECGRVFDLLDEVDAEEMAYGHDCEVSR
jgi:hydrogenase maturation factor HypF (carbamoyltransferase family)